MTLWGAGGILCVVCATCGSPRGGGEPESRAMIHRSTVAIGRCSSAGTGVGGFVHGMTSVPLDPLEMHLPACELGIELLQNLLVEHGFAVSLAPSPTFPSRHPPGAAVDGVLRVTQDRELLTGVTSGAQQVQHRGELPHVVGALRPAAGSPGGVVDVPRPPSRARIVQTRPVSCCSDQRRTPSYARCQRGPL